jgi:alkylation response protein AidB-like acyl-CoA dehydrogenase
MTHWPLDEIRRFMIEAVRPLEATLLAQGFGAVLPQLNELRAEVKARGWWTPHLPEELGGMGLPLLEFAQLSEVLGQTPLGHYIFNCQAPDIGNMELLHRHGSAEQHERWLKPLAAGAVRSCFAMTEPEHAGSNPVWLSTTAVRDGDDVVINGHKWFTTAADGAAFTVIMAVSDPNAEKPHRRASMYLAAMDTPGIEFVRNIPIMGERGEDWLSHAELRFHDVRVPASNRLGPEGAGFALAQERLGPGRIHHCMRWIGISERVLDLLCRYALKRELSPGHPLAEKQVIHRAVQVHGGLGVTDDTLLSFWYRHERAARIYDGADEVHKDVVARAVLKGYGYTGRG